MILLTFNIIDSIKELKYGGRLSREERSSITIGNTKSILWLLENHNVKATFFVEISLAENHLEFVRSIFTKGHEISLYSMDSDVETIERVKRNLEEYLSKIVRGLRQKNQILPLEKVKSMEFSYTSNIENAQILFPLKRLIRTTEIIEKQGVSIVPESISPYAQLPYNDFTFQVFPSQFYTNMVRETLKKEEFVMIYLDSWQFTNLEEYPFDLPFYRKINSGKKMEDKLSKLLTWINENELATSRMKDYIF